MMRLIFHQHITSTNAAHSRDLRYTYKYKYKVNIAIEGLKDDYPNNFCFAFSRTSLLASCEKFDLIKDKIERV